MSSIARFLHPIRALRSPVSRLVHPNPPKVVNLSTWIKGLVPATRAHSQAPIFDCKLLIRGFFGSRSFGGFGGKLSLGSIAGGSFIFGNIFPGPKIALCSDGLETRVDDKHGGLLNDPDYVDNQTLFWMYFSKFWLPALFAATVFVYLNQPLELIVRAVLFLLSTKPSPLSVYLFIEQMCYWSMNQGPVRRLKSLHANKVEVRDYKLLCLARVELTNQKLHLVGILGGWWELHL